MMSKNSVFDWRFIFEITAVVSVVLSLIFVGYELRLSRDNATMEGFNAASELNHSVRSLIANNSDVWARGCMGEELSDQDRDTFMNIVGARSNNAFTGWNRAVTGITRSNPEFYVRDFALSLYYFPGFRDAYFASREMGYNTIAERVMNGFSLDVDKMYDELLSAGISKEMDVALCGR